MTLQNKNNQFLSGAQDTDTDDALDIFAQYGADDDADNDARSSLVSHDQQDSDDNGSGDTTMGEQDVMMHATEEVSDDTTAVIEDVPVAEERSTENTQHVQEMRSWEEKMINDDSDTPTPVDHSHEQSREHKVLEEEKKEISVAPEPSVDNVATVEPQNDDHHIDTEESSVDHVPVAPPMRENINAVVQKESLQQKKKSTIQQDKRPMRTQPSIDPAKKTIVIVDDDIDTLDMYASIFESADYNVLRASDGLEALSVISEHTPHLIFTGIVMPRMDGFAMMEALKQNPRTADVPVVINSHLGRDADRKRAEELGARDFIVRGFTPPREALERIGALLLRSEYTFHFDINDPEARKLVRDLGASNFFVCPRGQEMVIKLSVSDPKNLTFSARFSCVDEPKE